MSLRADWEEQPTSGNEEAGSLWSLEYTDGCLWGPRIRTKTSAYRFVGSSGAQFAQYSGNDMGLSLSRPRTLWMPAGDIPCKIDGTQGFEQWGLVSMSGVVQQGV